MTGLDVIIEAHRRDCPECRARLRAEWLSMVPPAAVAALVIVLPVPTLLAAPMVLGAGWVARRVVLRRLERTKERL